MSKELCPPTEHERDEWGHCKTCGAEVCVDCWGTPKHRLSVAWKDNETDEEFTTTCTSSFHVIVKREAQAYNYLDASFVPIHSTSVPMTDQEALEYFSAVDAMFDETVSPVYITRRGFEERATFAMMPYTYDPETREVNKIEGAQES